MERTGYLLLARAAVLVALLPLHECAHALVAHWLGDDTAKQRGHLTLNPLRHFDLLGGGLILLLGFGWAKPAPFTPDNFRHPRRDAVLAALAGPAANLLFALLFTAVYQAAVAHAPYHRESYGYELLLLFLGDIIATSLLLTVFNLLPAPPLDGFQVVKAFLPEGSLELTGWWEIAGLAIVTLLMVTGVLSAPVVFLTDKMGELLLFLTKPIGWIA